MSKISDEVENIIINLRDRTGKPPLSDLERFQLLNEIYDGLLYSWRECVINGYTKGSGALSHQLEAARLEMADFKRTQGISDRRRVSYEYELPKDRSFNLDA